MNDKTTLPKRLRVLRRSCRLNGLRTMLTLLLLLCATTAFSQAQWTEVKLPKLPFWMSLKEMVWADSLHGYIFGRWHGVILKTLDGGVTWSLDSLPPGPDSLIYRSGFELAHAEFKGKEFGVVTYKRYSNRDSLLFFTTDAGKTWDFHLINYKTPFKNTMNPPGSQLHVDANRALFLYYTRQYDDSVIANVIARSDDYGALWRELGADTLNPENQYNRDNYRRYVLLDSLTHYSFTTMYDLGEFVGSWARVSSDGGRHWSYFPENHPLAQIGGYDIASVRVHRDTTIALTLRRTSPSATASVGIVSTDVQRHQTPVCWYVYVHPFSYRPGDIGKFVGDILYGDGTHIVRVEDTVVVFRENPPEKALKIGSPFSDGQTILQPNGRLWHLNGGLLWVLDYRTLGSVGTLPALSPAIEGFECYPQPFLSSSGVLTLIIKSKQAHLDVAFAMYDNTGRRLYEREIGDIAPGSRTVQLDLSGAPLSQLPASAVLFIELRTQYQRFYTKSLFLNK